MVFSGHWYVVWQQPISAHKIWR